MATPTAAPARARRRKMPGQLRLLAAAAMMLIGAFLPWLYTPVGQISGMRGPGMWTATFAMIALAGALVPIRTLAMWQAAVCAIPAIVLPLWQFWRVFSQVGMEGWMPGPGLVLTLASGVLCLVAARQLYQLRSA